MSPAPIFTFGDTNMRTRFSCGAREFCNRWSEAGPYPPHGSSHRPPH